MKEAITNNHVNIIVRPQPGVRWPARAGDATGTAGGGGIENLSLGKTVLLAEGSIPL
jgi:hypothetical protein